MYLWFTGKGRKYENENKPQTTYPGSERLHLIQQSSIVELDRGIKHKLRLYGFSGIRF